MCVLTVTAVTSLTVPAPVVDWTDMSTESEDSGNLMPQPETGNPPLWTITSM